MNYYIFFLKKDLYFLKKYIFEVYTEIFNFKVLNYNLIFLKKKISIIKNVIFLKTNRFINIYE